VKKQQPSGLEAKGRTMLERFRLGELVGKRISLEQVEREYQKAELARKAQKPDSLLIVTKDLLEERYLSDVRRRKKAIVHGAREAIKAHLGALLKDGVPISTEDLREAGRRVEQLAKSSIPGGADSL